MEVSFFLSLLLEEHFEFLLLLVNFKSVHFIFSDFIVREDIVL